ncbi:uncharacterized protein LOC131613969 [Vicia villosa]|uniref:uncharacterized protein LOC131613969 n=1 Tax=Vicia villosa TaxID=3911 RepID=UPI00273BD8E9|nr:uncharacterized protein LOC131613969 [Vicia villosa]
MSQFMFSCQSIKYLNLSLSTTIGRMILTQSLDLPELTYCHLKEVRFLGNNINGCVDPFSSCKKLTTLILESCKILGKTKLIVSNASLSKLIIQFGPFFIYQFQIQINTPNLKSFTFAGRFSSINHTNPIFENNFQFLEEVDLELWFPKPSKEIAETLMSWLKRFKNVYSMTLASPTLAVFSSMPNFPKVEDVCFENMESVLIKIDPFEYKFPKEVLTYLLKNSRCNEIITTFAGFGTTVG